jgi:hypothetical protein
MQNKKMIILTVAVVWIAATACSLGSQAAKLKELSTQVADVQTQVVPSLQAQLTEVAPTLQSQMENLPTEAAAAGGSFTDFKAAPEIVIGKVMQHIRSLKSYREHVETFKNGEASGVMDFEIVNPDRMHGTIQNDTVNSEVVMIDKDFYIKIKDTWMKIDLPMDLRQYALAFESMNRDLKEFKVIGPDTLDGRPTMVIEFSYTTDTVDYTSKMWLGVLDGNPYKVETHFTKDTEEYQVLTTLSDFDADITIEAPIP